MMVVHMVILSACAAGAPNTVPTIGAVAGGGVPLATDNLVPIHHEPRRIAGVSPSIQECQLIDQADQRGLVFGEGIAPPTSRASMDVGGVEDEVAQQVMLENDGVGVNALELSGFDRHLLGNGDLIRGESSEGEVAAASDMVDRPTQAFTHLLDELHALKRSFGLENQIPVSRAIGLKSQFEFQQ